ncbi:MAG: hypothetical protein ABI475_06650 [Methylophilaceae bacterium]
MDIIQIMLHLNQHLDTILAQHGTLAYAVLFAIVFCEMGLLPLFFLPGGGPVAFYQWSILRNRRTEYLDIAALAVRGDGARQ